MVISKDFKEFIKSLNEHKVRYLVIGGYAVAFHGHPRYTKDLDVWVSMDSNNIRNLIQALHDFGLSSLQLTEEDFQDPETIVQLGYPPNRIDLLVSIKGVGFDECYRSKQTYTIEGTKIDFIDLENLRKNKLATGRHQDLADLEKLR